MPAGSTLVVRATGKLDLDVAGNGGVTAAEARRRTPRAAPRSTASTSPPPAPRRLRGVGDDLTWTFNAIPDKPPTIALAKDPEQQARGSLLLSYQLEDDYGVDRSARDVRAQG